MKNWMGAFLFVCSVFTQGFVYGVSMNPETVTTEPIEYPITLPPFSNRSGYQIHFNQGDQDKIESVQSEWIVPTFVRINHEADHSECLISIGIDYVASNGEIESVQIGTGHCWDTDDGYSRWDIDNGFLDHQKNYFWIRTHSTTSNLSMNECMALDGDQISAKISNDGSGNFTIQLKNLSMPTLNGVANEFTFFLSPTLHSVHSAKWTVEDKHLENTPGIPLLPRFQPIQFTNCSATVNNQPGPINDSRWKHNSLNIQEFFYTLAETQNLTTDQKGSSFIVRWKRDHVSLPVRID